METNTPIQTPQPKKKSKLLLKIVLWVMAFFIFMGWGYFNYDNGLKSANEYRDAREKFFSYFDRQSQLDPADSMSLSIGSRVA